MSAEKKPNKSQVRGEIVAAILGSGNECQRFRKIKTIAAREETYLVTCSEQNEYQMHFDALSKKWVVLEKVLIEKTADTMAQTPPQVSDSSQQNR